MTDAIAMDCGTEVHGPLNRCGAPIRRNYKGMENDRAGRDK
jgi:hypothetical protein